MAQFVKNLAIAVFGIDTLKNSSVTGAKANRNKNKKQETPRPALDSTKLQAIRATVKHYAMSEKGEDEVTADYEAQQIGTHIAHKIYELNNPPNRKGRRKQSPILMHEVTHVECANERNENDTIPKNTDSSVSHSVTETNNVTKEHVIFSDKECDREMIDSSAQGDSCSDVSE
ncbi:Coiled-coil domain-containing protein C1orf165 [Harpegnathos saltator]|uniref:Coiled-coil domain-containing protein C1orf165 n=1 Tax=Harpegnathos saltator TaxID=610380 RepID=E2BUD2_HARSA|nr:Coiled-coil domain-containing protein C1orf165 [Harpegnathos saltator]